MSDELSPIEAIMWRSGPAGSLRMTVGAVLIVDQLPDRDALLERLRFAGHHAERLTQRPGGQATLRSRPSWVSGPFSPEHQLRSLSVSPPGTIREVLDLVGLLESVPSTRMFAVGRHADRRTRGRQRCDLPARPSRAHRRRRRIQLLGLLLDEPEWPRAPLTPSAPTAPPPPRVADSAGPRRPGTISFSATLDGPRSSAVRSGGSTRPARSTRSSRRCTACSGPSTSPTRCPDSSW